MSDTFKGLVFVRQGRVDTKGEGPDYLLQTARGDLTLVYKDRHPEEPDPMLEFFSRQMVEIFGTLDGRTLRVETIRQILSPHIPRA